jgi:hypothetical protein
MFDSLAMKLREEKSGPTVLVTSADAPNLKTVLKKIIRQITKDTRFDEEKSMAGVWEDDISGNRASLTSRRLLVTTSIFLPSLLKRMMSSV